MAIVNSIRSAVRFLWLSRLDGALVWVDKFPALGDLSGDMFYNTGPYLIDSLVVHENNVEIGLSHPLEREHLAYFKSDDIRFHVISRPTYPLRKLDD